MRPHDALLQPVAVKMSIEPETHLESPLKKKFRIKRRRTDPEPSSLKTPERHELRRHLAQRPGTDRARATEGGWPTLQVRG